MRTKVTLVLIFLNVALFFFIFRFERNWRTEAETLETRRRVLGPEAADIRSLTLTAPATGASLGLVRQRDTWSLANPLNWPANQHAVSSMVSELHLLEHLATFSVAEAARNKQSLADYGLEKPRLVVEFTSGDPAATGGATRPPTRLLLGDPTPDGKRLYVLSPDGQRVHVVNRSLLDNLSLPVDQLRADTVLSVRVFEARSLSLQLAADPGRAGGAPPRVRILRDGATQRWRFAAPHTAAASKTALELRINELNALKAGTFNPTPAPATLPSAAPALRITLEGNNRTETLYLGEPVPRPPGAAAAKPAAGTELFAQLEGRDALFTVVVPNELLESLRHAQESLREKRFLEFDPAAVTALTLASPLQSNQPSVTLQRLEGGAGQVRDGEQAWQVVYRTEGEPAPQTLPADPAIVRAALQRLNLLTAESFKSDAPSNNDLEEWGFNRPAREVTLAVTGAAAPLVLRLGTDATRSVYYARVGTATEPGASIYTVGADLVNDLPLAPSAWRNRNVTEPLPAVARITALKLTDVLEKKVLAEHAFDANGQPTAPPRDPKALAAVVSALRQLRAREFVPGGFAERIFAAGEDRTWRFQLEATIALPGSAGQEVTRTFSLLLTERLGGSLQFAGTKELEVAFSLEQPLVDALWSLAYGARDPGPPAPPSK
jgi:hypothetical protein